MATAKKTAKPVDIVDQAKDAQDKAAEETAALAKPDAQGPRQPPVEPDAGLSAVMLDAARKAENAKRNAEADAAADLGNGYRIRADAIEYVGPAPAEHRRQFDVGGQPVFDQELAAKSSANFAAEQEKAAKKAG